MEIFIIMAIVLILIESIIIVYLISKAIDFYQKSEMWWERCSELMDLNENDIVDLGWKIHALENEVDELYRHIPDNE